MRGKMAAENASRRQQQAEDRVASLSAQLDSAKARARAAEEKAAQVEGLRSRVGELERRVEGATAPVVEQLRGELAEERSLWKKRLTEALTLLMRGGARLDPDELERVRVLGRLAGFDVIGQFTTTRAARRAAQRNITGALR